MSMPSGYCYEYDGSNGEHGWRGPTSDDWDIVVYTATGSEKRVGERHIDGTRCVVFCCADGKYRAVNKVNVPKRVKQ